LRCGNRQIEVKVQPDTRTAEAIERNGPVPETRARLGRDSVWRIGLPPGV